MNKKYYFFCILSVLGMLIGCGSSGSGETAGISGSGKTLTIASVGSINGIDNQVINVNGVEYEISDAEFLIDDNLGNKSDLAVGQVIALSGNLYEDQVTGVAGQVTLLTNVSGPIQSVDVINSSLIVLGQTILLDEKTLLVDVSNLGQLKAKQLINVSGFVNSERQIIATRIDVVDNLDHYQVIGTINNLNTTDLSFSINDLTVDYTNAFFEDDFVNDDNVKITGIVTDAGVFIAQTLKQLDIGLDDTAELADVEGLVTDVISPTIFLLNGIRISTAVETQYENGTAADIGLNARLQVKAFFNNSGELIANKIIVIHSGPTLVTATIQHGERLTYEMMSTDLDIGLWSSLFYQSDAVLELYVHADRDATSAVDCFSWVGTENSRYCYVDNVQASTWYITVEYPDTAIVDDAVEFELSSYLRRLPIAEPIVIGEGDSVNEVLFSGDRRAYRLTAGPEGSYSVLTIDALDEDFYLYVKADEYPIKTRWERLCNIKGSLTSIGGETICRLPNDGVNDWYIIVEAAGETEYQLAVEYINPIILSANDLIFNRIEKRSGNIYQFDTVADEKTLSLLLANTDAIVNMRVTTDVNLKNYDCITRIFSIDDKQCNQENNGVNRWYIVTTGEVGANYSLQAFSQTNEIQIKELNAGDSDTATHAAGEKTVYKVPRGPEGSVFSVFLTGVTANFGLQITADQLGGSLSVLCESRAFNTDDKDCRLLNEGDVTDWYITVDSVFAGSYTLSVENQTLSVLEQETPLSDEILSANGNLYTMAADRNVESFSFNVTNESSPVELVVALRHPPYGKEISCNSLRVPGGVCRLTSQIFDGTYPDWYILVKADVGATYTLTAVAE